MSKPSTQQVKKFPHSHPHVVALTGGIGSGKSTARSVFAELGIPCIDADQVARDIHQNPQHPVMATIAKFFPESVSHEGRLKRGSLRKKLVVDPEANLTFKQLLKPYVMAEIERWTQAMTSPYVVWESALIIEENIRADRVLVVDAADDMRIERIRTRNPDWTMAQVQDVLSIQLPGSVYLTHADDVIRNHGYLTELRQQVEKLHCMYLKKWS